MKLYNSLSGLSHKGFLFIALWLALVCGCSEWFMEEPLYVPTIDESLISIDSTAHELEDDYEKLCIRTEYYFCPGVSGPLMRIKITKDVCTDPPTVLSMSECEEYLECDPHYYVIGEYDCETEEGYPGTYTTYCVKGFRQDSDCEGLQDNTPESDLNPQADHTPYDVYDIFSPDEVYECAYSDSSETCIKKDVDILVIIDLSASMVPEIQSVYDTVNTFSIEHQDATHIRWSLIVGPKNSGNKPGNHNFLYLASNVKPIEDFQSAMFDILSYDMIGQYEMLYDALYLSLRNISGFLPYSGEKLLWPVWVGNVIDESIPPLQDFYVNWREKSNKVIIIFTDEPGQSFLIPESMIGKSYNTNDTITQSKLTMMLKSTENISVYTFTDPVCKDAWEPFTAITSGASYDLDMSPLDTSDKLQEIFNKEICY